MSLNKFISIGIAVAGVTFVGSSYYLSHHLEHQFFAGSENKNAENLVKLQSDSLNDSMNQEYKIYSSIVQGSKLAILYLHGRDGIDMNFINQISAKHSVFAPHYGENVANVGDKNEYLSSVIDASINFVKSKGFADSDIVIYANGYAIFTVSSMLSKSTGLKNIIFSLPTNSVEVECAKRATQTMCLFSGSGFSSMDALKSSTFEAGVVPVVVVKNKADFIGFESKFDIIESSDSDVNMTVSSKIDAILEASLPPVVLGPDGLPIENQAVSDLNPTEIPLSTESAIVTSPAPVNSVTAPVENAVVSQKQGSVTK